MVIKKLYVYEGRLLWEDILPRKAMLLIKEYDNFEEFIKTRRDQMSWAEHRFKLISNVNDEILNTLKQIGSVEDHKIPNTFEYGDDVLVIGVDGVTRIQISDPQYYIRLVGETYAVGVDF